ncbi:hypothetical protein EDD22DRAFT_1011498 [Suillus occidentalis]|nr:hypothetical protein EDD22DRAFT_1011498 [Suillus occidentalis]
MDHKIIALVAHSPTSHRLTFPPIVILSSAPIWVYCLPYGCPPLQLPLQHPCIPLLTQLTIPSHPELSPLSSNKPSSLSETVESKSAIFSDIFSDDLFGSPHQDHAPSTFTSPRLSGSPDLQSPFDEIDPEKLAKQDPLATQVWKMYARQEANQPHAQTIENITWRMMALALKKKEEEDAANANSDIKSGAAATPIPDADSSQNRQGKGKGPECFEMDDVTVKVVSAVVGATLDKEKLIRDQAFTAIELCVKRLRLTLQLCRRQQPQKPVGMIYLRGFQQPLSLGGLCVNQTPVCKEPLTRLLSTLPKDECLGSRKGNTRQQLVLHALFTVCIVFAADRKGTEETRAHAVVTLSIMLRRTTLGGITEPFSYSGV